MKKTLILLSILSTVALGVTVKQNVSLNAFNAGELSPLMNSRSDITQYKTGAKTLENMLVRSQGPIQRRPGTKYIATVKDGNDPTRLFPFEYSTDLTYIVEAGDDYFRFFRDGGQIYDGDDPYEVNSPYDANDIFEVQFAQDAQTMRFVHPDYPPYKLERTGHTSWTMTEIDFEGGPFSDENEDEDITITPSGKSGDIDLEANSGIFDDDHVGALWQINHIVEANTVSTTFYGGNAGVTSNGDSLTVEKGRLWRFTTNTGWRGTIAVQKSYDDGSTWEDVSRDYYDILEGASFAGKETERDALYRNQFIYPSSPYGSCSANLTALSFKVQGVVEITSVTDSNSASGTVQDDYIIGSTDATWRWSEGAWSTYRGFPRSICHHEQRCIYGGSESYPQTVWASIIARKDDDYDIFDPAQADSDADAWNYILPGMNHIQWLVSREYLMVGTSNAIGRLGWPDKPITPTYDPIYRIQAINGSAYIQAVPAGDTILFVERGGKKVREITYTHTSERYIAPDMTILAEHITGDGITSIALQQRPDIILWAVRDDGQLLSFTYNRHYGTESWSRHTTGASGEFESVATISGSTEDELWTLTKRTINSTDERYIEQFQPLDWYADEDMNDAYFVDCGTDANDTLSHLEGETVTVWGDGEPNTTYTVSSGEINLGGTITNMTIGLPYTSTLETMPLIAYTDLGSSASYMTQVQNLVLDLYETLDFNVGSSSDKKTAQSISALTSGPWPTDYPRSEFREACMYLDVNEPSPFTLRGLSAQLTIKYVQ